MNLFCFTDARGNLAYVDPQEVVGVSKEPQGPAEGSGFITVIMLRTGAFLATKDEPEDFVDEAISFMENIGKGECKCS